MSFIRKVSDFISVICAPSYEEESISFLELNGSDVRFNNHREIPKVIWLYWDSEELPTLVELCIDEMKSICKDFEIILLNDDNVNGFIDVPKFHSGLEKANVSDFIRLKLLSTYGGFWLDASILLNENIEWVLKKFTDQDAFLFYSDECTQKLSYPIFENWFIACPKNSLFISDWLEEYTRCIQSDDPKKYYYDFKDNVNVMQNISKPDYLLAYISASVVYNEGKRKYKILTLPSSKVGHYYSYKHSFDGFKIAIDLLLKGRRKLFVPKLIKFNSSSRNSITKMLKYNLFSKHSLIGYIFKKR